MTSTVATVSNDKVQDLLAQHTCAMGLPDYHDLIDNGTVTMLVKMAAKFFELEKIPPLKEKITKEEGRKVLIVGVSTEGVDLNRLLHSVASCNPEKVTILLPSGSSVEVAEHDLALYNLHGEVLVLEE
jgi:hypothetical protein